MQKERGHLAREPAERGVKRLLLHCADKLVKLLYFRQYSSLDRTLRKLHDFPGFPQPLHLMLLSVTLYIAMRIYYITTHRDAPF